MEERNEVTVENSYLKVIEKMIENIQYGSVTVVIQDGKVIQIEKTEKCRIKN